MSSTYGSLTLHHDPSSLVSIILYRSLHIHTTGETRFADIPVRHNVGLSVMYLCVRMLFLISYVFLRPTADFLSFLRSMSGRRSRLDELMPCRSIQSAPPCCRQAEIERVQIVLDRSQPGFRMSTGSASPIFGKLGGPQMQAGKAREWS